MDGIGSTEMLHIFIGSPQDGIVGGSTGRAVPGYVAEIHDDDGARVPADTIGRLAVKGPTGCRYLDDERQAAYVRNGWNYPGDAYRQDADGYFWYVARTDDMIIASGYNVSGPEVEQVLLAHGEVKECAVIGKPVPEKQTNIVKAYVVPADASKAGPEIRTNCKSSSAPASRRSRRLAKSNSLPSFPGRRPAKCNVFVYGSGRPTNLQRRNGRLRLGE